MNKKAFFGGKFSKIFSRFVYFCTAWFFVSTIYILKSPVLPHKIFAEDGSVYIQEALDLSFRDALFTPYSGYGDLISRLGAELIIHFPIQLWSYGTFVYSTFWLALILLALVKISTETFKNRIIGLTAPFSLLLLPITNFDAIVSMSYLRFFFLAALFPIFFTQNNYRQKSILIFLVALIAPLMMPLTILFLPIALWQVYRSKIWVIFNLKAIKIQAAFILSCLFQIIFIALFAYGERKLLFDSSSIEVLYLLLDRVIGSALVPGWGLVSQPPMDYNLFAITLNNRYLIRGITAFVISLVIFYLVLNIKRKNSGFFRQIIFQYSFLFLSWFLISFLWAPEPRYALAIGFWFLWTTLQLLDFYLVDSTKFAFLLLVLVPLTWIMSWVPSEYRRSGDSWTESFSMSQSSCLDENKYVSIKIAPQFHDGRPDLMLRIKCDLIL